MLAERRSAEMWSHLPIAALTDWQSYEPDQGRLRSGTRVLMTRHGAVSYERSGFALVRWDDGTESLEWASELKEAA